MDEQLIRVLAENGDPTAQRVLDRINARKKEEVRSNNSITNMDKTTPSVVVEEKPKQRWFNFRCPEIVYNKLQQHHYLTNQTMSAIIKTAILQYLKWEEVTNELRLQEATRKASGYKDLKN